MNTHKISFLLFAFVFSFLAITPRAEAVSCLQGDLEWNYNPSIEVNIVSNTYNSSGALGSADLPYGNPVPFTVTGYDYPGSSIFTITYPYGTSSTYDAQSAGTGKSFSIPAINESVNGERSLNVSLNPNCTIGSGYEPAPITNLNIPIYVTAPAVCSINSFTADSYSIPYNTGTTLRFSLSGGSFSWAISLLSGSVNSSPTSGVGSAGTASTNNLTGTQAYRLSCNGGQATRDVTVSVQSAPPGSIPAISSQWTANSSSYLTQPVPQSPSTQLFTIPLIFWNSGESGSTVNVTGCTPHVIPGTIGTVDAYCPPTTLIK